MHNLIELKHLEKFVRKLDQNSKKVTAPDPMDDQHLYLGVSATRGSQVVSPELEAWVGKAFSSEYLALKERRKALEERKALQGSS